jgi:hypothetical protein
VNSVPNRFVEKKNSELRNFVLNLSEDDKMVRICSAPFRRRKNTRNFVLAIKQKKKLVPNHSIMKKNTWMTVKKQFFADFPSVPSVPNLGIGYSETHRIPQKEHFFPQNNENRSESIPRNFLGTEFRWQP